MKIIEPKKREHFEVYRLVFDCPDGSGFGFPCDAKGKVDIGELQPAALENYRKCLSGDFAVIPKGVEKLEWWHTSGPFGECSCGEVLELTQFTNACACGRDYDMGGNLLAPREQWGEETGEHWSDILRVN